MDVKTEPSTDYAAMADYLENLLMRQADKLRSYDLDGASIIAEQTAPIAEELTRRNILNRPDFAERKVRLERMYKDICLIISDQRQEVSDKLVQIRQGLRALGGYKGK